MDIILLGKDDVDLLRRFHKALERNFGGEELDEFEDMRSELVS